MLALIIVVCITAITTLGTNANNTFSYVGTQVGKTGTLSRATHRLDVRTSVPIPEHSKG